MAGAESTMLERTWEFLPGENTAYRPESVAAAGELRSIQNMDDFTEKQSLGKVPGTQVVSANHGSAVRSMHFYERVDRDYQRRRSLITLADDGVLREMSVANGSLSNRYAGLRPERLVDVQHVGKLFLSSPNQLGLPTGGLRVDGSLVSSWGLLGPSDNEVIMEPWDGSLAGSYVASIAEMVLAADPIVTKHTTSGLSISKPSGTGFSVEVRHDLSAPVNFSNAAEGGVFYQWVYIPVESFRSLGLGNPSAPNTAMHVTLYSDSLTKNYRYDFTLGELTPGWQLLSFVLSAPSSTVGGGANLSAVTAIRFGFTLGSSIGIISGVVVSKLFGYRNGAPVATGNGAGLINGTVSYRVLYVRSDGKRSNGSTSSNSLVRVNQQSAVALPSSPDPDVIARWVYRDLNSDALFRFVGSVDNNRPGEVFIDNVPTTSVGEPDMPLAGQDGLDASPPPRMKALALHENRVIGIDAENPTTLVISEVGDPESFRLLDRLSVEVQLTSLQRHAFGTLLFSENKALILTGDGVNTPFVVTDVTDTVGANGAYATLRIRNEVIALREHELYSMTNPADPMLMNEQVEDQFRALGSSLATMELAHDRGRRRLLCLIPGSTLLRYFQFGGTNDDTLSLREGRWGKIVLPSAIVPNCMTPAVRTDRVPELWVGAADGYVYQLQAPGVLNYEVGAAAPQPVVASFRTHVRPLGNAPMTTGTPRFLRINAASDVPSTWTVTVRLFTDVGATQITSKSKTFVVGPNGTASIIRLPRIGASGEYADLEFTNANPDENGRFRSVTLLSEPRGSFRGPKAR